MSNPILEVVNLTVSYSQNNVLDNLSISVYPNEIVGLIGENGAGKTTLLKSILGVKQISKGSVLFEGSAIAFPAAYERMAFVSDESNFYPFWSAKTNLRFFSSHRQTLSRIELLLQTVGLKDSMDKKVSTFSLGMRQRLNIARSLLNSPKLLLMDEPINSLDPIGTTEFKKGIKEYIAAENASLLISCHALKEMAFFCDKYLFLKNGKIEALIESDDDFEEYNAYITYDKNDLQTQQDFYAVKHFQADFLSRIYFRYEQYLDISNKYNVTILPKGSNVLEDIYISIAIKP